MNWLDDIIKNLAISKILVAAIFGTSVVMYWGPIVAPGQVPNLQPEVVPYVFAAMVLSAFLLVIWTVIWMWSFLQSRVLGSFRVLVATSLSKEETAVLFALAQDPTRPFNLSSVNYSTSSTTKLELHQIAKTLRTKGLVSINDWDDNLISLTESGRERALEIQRQNR